MDMFRRNGTHSLVVLIKRTFLLACRVSPASILISFFLHEQVQNIQNDYKVYVQLYIVGLCYTISSCFAAYRRFTVCSYIFICPIAIAYSMGQIIKPICVRVSPCEHSHVGISWLIFTKIGTDVKTPKSKNEFAGDQHRTISSPILPPKPPF